MKKSCKNLLIFPVLSLDLLDGGPPRSVFGLASNLAHAGTDAVVLELLKPKVDIDFSFEEINNLYVSRSNVKNRIAAQFIFPYKLAKLLYLSKKSYQNVYVCDNGIWSINNITVGLICTIFGIKYTVHPRGMLEEWALQYRARKKMIAWITYQRILLKHCYKIFCTSQKELDTLFRKGFHENSILLANGVHLPTIDVCSLIKLRYKKRQVIFLGRLHKVKNLLALIDAWGLIKK